MKFAKYLFIPLLSLVTAHADTFDFTYTYPRVDHRIYTGVVTGTLTGTQNGDNLTDYVTGVTVTSLFVDGYKVLSPFSTAANNYAEDGGGFTLLGLPVVSFDGALNNFLFTGADYIINGTPISSGSFYVDHQPWAEVTSGATYVSNSLEYDYFPDGSHWSLVKVITASDTAPTAPDTGATIALFGCSLLGLAALHRRFAV